ncbi:hypothetical protein HN51_049950 [Arachis hypogaea]
MKVRVKGMGFVEQNPEIRGFTVLNGDLVFATNKNVYAYDTLHPCGIGAKNLRPYLQLRKHDQVEKIFSWLPAKAIHNFKSSSKLFSELPKTPYFVAKQAENSLKKDRPSCFFIQRDDILNHNDCVELHPLLGRGTFLRRP